MSTYNLIDESWIPVCYNDGSRGEVGLGAVLLRAADIRSIEHESPLVIGGLYRLLLAILYRALGDANSADKVGILRDGFPKDALDAYFTRWRDRFWLHDDAHPFWQTPGFRPKEYRSWSVLATEHNVDNSKVLFDHVDVTAKTAIPARMAARWLVARQSFAVSSGKSELAHTSTGPSATSMLVFPLGRSLRDSLAFALKPQPSAVTRADSAVWERDPETVDYLRTKPSRPARGVADIYTWPSRAILLVADEGATVSKVAFASGVDVVDSGLRDPLVPFREDKEHGLLPLQFRENRGIWRDFDSLLPDRANHAPEVINYVHELAAAISDLEWPQHMLILGMSADQAKINFWRMEQCALPRAACLPQTEFRSEIRSLLERAEDYAGYLRRVGSAYAESLITRPPGKPDKAAVRAVADNLPCLPAYWSFLEADFQALLSSLREVDDATAMEKGWLDSIDAAFRRAWGIHCNSVAGSGARELTALARADSIAHQFLRQLAALRKEYEEGEETPVS